MIHFFSTYALHQMNINLSSTLSDKEHRCGWKIFLAMLNILSTGADEAGTHSDFSASFARAGRVVPWPFQNTSRLLSYGWHGNEKFSCSSSLEGWGWVWVVSSIKLKSLAHLGGGEESWVSGTGGTDWGPRGALILRLIRDCTFSVSLLVHPCSLERVHCCGNLEN